MPTITKITTQVKRANRRNIFIDGAFAFGVNLNVVAKFKLNSGQELSADQIAAIQAGELRQECFDSAIGFLSRRMHTRSELGRKLVRKEFGAPVINSVLDQLEKMKYVDDTSFAKARALSLMQHKHHGKKRALIELRRAGVSAAIAEPVLNEVYAEQDATSVAMELAMKQKSRLAKLDPQKARQRLTGMLLRRGFDFKDIKIVVDEVVGKRK